MKKCYLLIVVLVIVSCKKQLKNQEASSEEIVSHEQFVEPEFVRHKLPDLPEDYKVYYLNGEKVNPDDSPFFKGKQVVSFGKDKLNYLSSYYSSANIRKVNDNPTFMLEAILEMDIRKNYGDSEHYEYYKDVKQLTINDEEYLQYDIKFISSIEDKPVIRKLVYVSLGDFTDTFHTITYTDATEKNRLSKSLPVAISMMEKYKHLNDIH